MRSILLEFVRFGAGHGILSEGESYLTVPFLVGDTVREFKIPLSSSDFRELMGNLRYRVAESDRQAALETLSGKVTAILHLQPPAESLDASIHLDLVTNAAELWALPFEAARGSDGTPLFVNREQVVVPTRRFRPDYRTDFADRISHWPSHPKVLFAAASPRWAGPQVPAEAHKDALRVALRPWIEPLEGFPQAVPDERSVLHILDDASLEDIEQACKNAVEDRQPFTHVHIVAHGWHIADPNSPYRTRFGLALCSERPEPTEAEELARVLTLDKRTPVVVTLAVCDSGAGSIAQTLHRSGIPVVVASLLPLTFDGSTVLTKEFYEALLSGEDVRIALHRARVALYEASEVSHDWVSVVAYVQLPEGYEDLLRDTRLQAEVASLSTAQFWSDHIIEHQLQSKSTFDHVAEILRERIEALTRFLADHSVDTLRTRYLAENASILGSAKKQLAELLFIRASLGHAPPLLEESRKFLESAYRAYVEGYDRDLSHYWIGVQQLSLEAVLTGMIKEPHLWHFALRATKIDRRENHKRRENNKAYWPQGSIAELLLLAPLAEQGSRLDQACEVLVEMKQRVKDHADDNLPIESMRRQFRRYTEWWTKENGFFGDRDKDLAEDAARLIQVLESV